ncbi:cyclic nucleotide-binding/CBS domain-containing protein [Alginatibacterium sediminis]|uniref:Cyclic nucleotide-binding/CBS domain-containing protein n=1 Tax=Alginatibacterium sediminis TaxID=2164068 RepID=A0A420E7K6_9ALTE|nr:DUF294 nucleotidyltransferase-like domain-containing protein [Alginatibacterium sediminis]RKF14474.1 cyclic nucleotide-binding/CBS domain-containing protein [Alginatibacterium sediminis]
MAQDFNFDHPPFSQLSPQQREQLSDRLDISYFKANEKILSSGQSAEFFHIIIKGAVEERANNNDEVFAQYSVDDYFDVRSQFGGYCKHDYIALEDSLCYKLKTTTFMKLVQENPEFGDYFQVDLAQRHQLVESREGNKNLAEFILTQIDDSNVQQAIIVDGNLTIAQATQQLKDQRVESLLVDHDGCIGMLTGTDLLHALALDNLDLSHPIADIAHYHLISVQKGEFLFNAMLLMTRNEIERVVVKDDLKIIGIIEMAHLLSLFSTHSHVLALRIARATSVEELQEAALTLDKLTENLLNNGIRTVFIMKLLATMNEQIIAKLFEIVVPEAYQNHVCLMVMGSEGRQEQILKTDQDNGIIIEDGCDLPELPAALNLFSEHLLELGYPPCPGKIMVNNPQWVKSQSEWLHTVRQWCDAGHGESSMNLAILWDALAVAGNKSLLKPIRKAIVEDMGRQDVALSFFAKAALSFNTPLTLFGGLKAQHQLLDIKKGGIFSIVHGVRAMALKHHIYAANTLDRIHLLTQKKQLDSELSKNLSEALLLFFKLRLSQSFGDTSGRSSNEINVRELNHSERDLLRHALHVVKKYKTVLANHFQIRDY